MEPLTEQQVARVQEHVRHSGVEQESLINDLTDHICTEIEQRLARGQPFDDALSEAASLFGQQGLRQIQLDTFELLNEITDTMKKAAFIIGLVSTSLLLTGTIFKLMHWMGAGILVLSGASALVLGYFPLLLRFKWKESPSNERPMHLAGFLGITLTTLGVLFKVFHWPGANVMLLSGMAVLAFAYVPLFYYMRYKTSSNRPVTLSTGLVAMTCLILVFALIQVNHSRSYDRGIAAVGESLGEAATPEGGAVFAQLADDPEAQRVRALADGTVAYLQRMRTTLIAEVENISLEEARAMKVTDLRQVSDHGVATDLIFTRTENLFYQDSVTQHLQAFRTGVLATYDDTLRTELERTFPYNVEKRYPSAEADQNWVQHWFYQVPTVGVLNQLAKLEYDVRQQEQQALLYLALRTH